MPIQVKGDGKYMPAYKDEVKSTWYVQFYYQDWQGKNVKKRKRGFKTKREALAWESEFKNSVDVNMNITLAEFVEIYFQDKSGELKERSIKNKRYMLERHVIPYLGKRRMDEITPSDVINWQKVMREKGYKPTYLRMVNNQLVALFTHAHNIYNLENSPCKKVKKMGKSDADKLSFWTKQDFDLFMATVDKRDRYYLIFMILFWTGCREGELLALTLNDIDFERNTINIDKTYFRSGGKDIITTPKTEGSVRVITIPQFLKEELEKYVSQLFDYPKDERLFPITARAVQKKLKAQIEKAGVPAIRVHDFRHSHVAFLINEGVQPLLIKERLGHKDIRITMNTYGHLYPNQQKSVADLLDSKQ